MTSPLHLRVGTAFAAAVVFIAAFEPNLAIRYGPLFAIAAFILSNPHRTTIGRTEWLLAAWLVWCTLNQFWTIHPAWFDLRWTITMSLAVMFFGVRAALRWGGHLTLVIAYAAGCVVGLARTSLQLVDAGITRYDDTGRVTQVEDLNVNYVAYSTVTAILLAVLILQSHKVQSRRAKFGVFVLLGALSVAVLSTQTRGAQIALILLGVWVVVSRFARPLKTVVAACVVVAVAVSAGLVNDTLALIDYGDRGRSGLSGRFGLWDIARPLWGENPLGGVGLDSLRQYTPYSLPAHNLYLGVGTAVGFIGLALLLGFLVSAVTDRLGDLPDRERRFRVGAILLTFIAITLSSSWENTASGWVGLALLSQPVTLHARKPAPVTTNYR